MIQIICFIFMVLAKADSTTHLGETTTSTSHGLQYDTDVDNSTLIIYNACEKIFVSYSLSQRAG